MGKTWGCGRKVGVESMNRKMNNIIKCVLVFVGVWVVAVGARAAVSPDHPVVTMPAVSWYTATNTLMSSVTPTNGQFAGTWGSGGPQAIISAWGGGALDSSRSRLVLWGGGHSDYFGNEVYAFDTITMAWERVTDPTINPTLGSEINWDGTPQSRHTYGGVSYNVQEDRFMAVGGALANTGFAGGTNLWAFDFVSKTWSRRSPPPFIYGGGMAHITSYDPVSNMLWEGTAYAAPCKLYSYDWNSDAWTYQLNAEASNVNFYYGASAVDTKRGLLFVICGGSLKAFTIHDSPVGESVWTTTGADAFVATGAQGLDYDPVADKLVGWSGGNKVYALDLDTRVWTVYDVSGGPTTANPQGVYGRWRYVPSLNAFVVVTSIYEDVHFFKLTAGVGAALTYGASAFTEMAATNGVIDNSTPLRITLTRDTFTGVSNEDFVATGKLVVTNLPAGLTAVATRTDAVTLDVTLLGTAPASAASDSVTNLTFQFQGTAFSVSTNAALVGNSACTNLQVVFYDNSLVYGSTVFHEAAANDGSIDNTTPVSIALRGDTFTGINGSDFVADGKVAVSNLSAGLTAVLTKVDDSHLNATLTGNAVDHAVSNNVSTLTFAFQNGAFSGGNATGLRMRPKRT